MNWPALITAIASVLWPLLALVVVLLFRRQLVALVDRLRTAKLPGGLEATFQYGEAPTDKVPSDAVVSSGPARLAAPDGIHWDNTGNLYWLGHDLMWVLDVLLRGGSRSDVVLSLQHAVHHARELGLAEVPPGARLVRLLTETERSLIQDWTPEARLQYASEIAVIRTELGRMISAHQPGYRSQVTA